MYINIRFIITERESAEFQSLLHSAVQNAYKFHDRDNDVLSERINFKDSTATPSDFYTGRPHHTPWLYLW